MGKWRGKSVVDGVAGASQFKVLDSLFIRDLARWKRLSCGL